MAFESCSTAFRALIFVLAHAALAPATAQTGIDPGFVYDRSNKSVKLDPVTYKGVPALRVLDRPEEGLNSIILIPGTEFHNGVIEAEVAGQPSAHAPPEMRGFIGIAFRVQKDPSHYEAFYIRPTNGRADDQLRRNHSTQYISGPDFPWHRLRRENPGVYESYADLVPGQWIKLRIEVQGDRARLYVGDANQPTLIVNDLKHGPDARGRVALWVGQGTEGFFRNIKVTAED